MLPQSVPLIPSSITNGRIYFDSECIKFFPADSFGDREESGHRGVPVVFEAGGQEFVTDIRVSSGQRLSPRASFSPFLKAVRAIEGDTLHIERVEARRYRVTHRSG